MIDIHCHILPGIDDGASDIEESLNMARIACEDGIHTIVASPHTLNNSYLNTRQEIARHVLSFQQVLTTHEINLKIIMGSDTHLCAQMVQRVNSGEAVTVNNNGKYLLVEFPFMHFSLEKYREELFQLKLNGITPIITHPERYPRFQDKPEILYDLVNMGCLVQLTAMSVTGEFGEDVMVCSQRILKHRLAHVLATDAHSSKNRPPILSSAVEAAAGILGDIDQAKRMVNDIPLAIVEGSPIRIPDPIPIKKKKWFFKF